MSTLSLRLPASLHKHLRELARKEGVSINQLITTAVAEKMAALMTDEYLAERARRGSREAFEAVLARCRRRCPTRTIASSRREGAAQPACRSASTTSPPSSSPGLT